MKSPLTRAPDPRSPQAFAPTSCDAARVIFPFNLLLRAPEPDDTSCARAGAESHSGCENPIEDGTPFDMWELARSWTPGFCASGGSRTCAKKECAPDVVDPSLTLHGMWPSFSKPVDASDAGSTRKLSSRETSAALASRGGGGGCFWPQNCAQPPWWPPTAPWGYDPALLPTDETSAALAPAWYDDDLGAHEWSKHGTCAAWSDANGAERGLDQEAYYDAMFELAKKEGTPEMLRNATGSSVSLKSLQDMFGGAGKVALGCTPKCELAQVVTCYSRGGEHRRTGRARRLPVLRREGLALRQQLRGTARVRGREGFVRGADRLRRRRTSSAGAGAGAGAASQNVPRRRAVLPRCPRADVRIRRGLRDAERLPQVLAQQQRRPPSLHGRQRRVRRRDVVECACRVCHHRVV